MATDERLGMIAELINGIKILKIFCWEDFFKKIVDDLRRLVQLRNKNALFVYLNIDQRKELKWIGRQYILYGSNLMLDFDFTSVVGCLCIALLFWTRPDSLILPIYVVYVFGYYYRISQALAYFTGIGLKYTTDALISIKRIEVFRNCFLLKYHFVKIIKHIFLSRNFY